jgi:hypothetical protein
MLSSSGASMIAIQVVRTLGPIDLLQIDTRALPDFRLVIDTLGCAFVSGDPLVGPVHEHNISGDVSSFGSIGDGRVKLTLMGAPLPDERWITFAGDLDDGEAQRVASATPRDAVGAAIERGAPTRRPARTRRKPAAPRTRSRTRSTRDREISGGPRYRVGRSVLRGSRS